MVDAKDRKCGNFCSIEHMQKVPECKIRLSLGGGGEILASDSMQISDSYSLIIHSFYTGFRRTKGRKNSLQIPWFGCRSSMQKPEINLQQKLSKKKLDDKQSDL